MNSSALVETVSVNYEDFNENFLTCGTCLSLYNGQEHSPKLLPCSHTVCRSCLESIVANTAGDGRSFRCPICRETILIPAGGVVALPPSFLVNQLLDLMAQQRREIVPKCPTHMSQELLFCETCDVIFCMLCQGSDHGGNHNVIPFSIAIKRMSEILLYKANQCTQNLDIAQNRVNQEIELLEKSTREVIERINSSFEEVESLLGQRREELLNRVYLIHKEKQHNLNEQLQLIHGERTRVDQDCRGMESEVEVRHITKKIMDINEKLYTTNTLSDPRDNSFMQYQWERHRPNLTKLISAFGSVKISTTFPALCKTSLEETTIYLQTRITLTTIDFHGNPRASGGDPITVTILDPGNEECSCDVQDQDNGVYEILFTPMVPGPHQMAIEVFGRPVRGSPFTVTASPHIESISRLGDRGTGHLEFDQPTNVACDPASGRVFVLDTGNCRIKVLGDDGSFHGHLLDSGGSSGGISVMKDKACTGITWTANGTLMTVNWRTRLVTELSGDDGRIVKQFTSPELVEPTALTATTTGSVVVADNGARALLVFDSSGCLVRKVPYDTLVNTSADCDKENKKRENRLSQGAICSKKRKECNTKKAAGLSYVSGIASMSNGECDEILVSSDCVIRVLSSDGNFLRDVGEPGAEGSKKGKYGGLAVDSEGTILATKTEKGRSSVEVFRAADNAHFSIDSFSDKLRRPSGLIPVGGHKVVVCDLGNDCIKTYRYK